MTTNTNHRKPTNNRHLLARYAGMAMQFGAAILVAVLLGRWVDGKLGWKFPAGTIFFPILVVVGMLVQVARDTNKK